MAIKLVRTTRIATIDLHDPLPDLFSRLRASSDEFVVAEATGSGGLGAGTRP